MMSCFPVAVTNTYRSNVARLVVCGGHIARLGEFFRRTTEKLATWSKTQVQLLSEGMKFIEALASMMKPYRATGSAVPKLVAKALSETGVVSLIMLLAAMAESSSKAGLKKAATANSSRVVSSALAVIITIARLDLQLVANTAQLSQPSAVVAAVFTFLLDMGDFHYLLLLLPSSSSTLSETIILHGLPCAAKRKCSTEPALGRSQRLCNACAHFPFNAWRCKSARTLFPTLIAICYRHSSNTCVVEEEVSTSSSQNTFRKAAAALRRGKGKHPHCGRPREQPDQADRRGSVGCI